MSIDYRDKINHLFYIMGQLNTMRADILQLLLENLANNKEKRLFLYMAQKAGHAWFDKLDLGQLSHLTLNMNLFIGFACSRSVNGVSL